jgi:hypothetical protein
VPLISSSLLNIDESAPQQKINRISTNFAKLLNQDENQQGYSLLCEISILKQSIQSQSYGLSKTLEESIINLDEDIYPTISQLVLINYTLPVSVASDERSFSNLTRLKSYLRNRMGRKGCQVYRY